MKMIPKILSEFPYDDKYTRIVLLHDPSGFEYVPKDDKCFVFSGHTHGGQVGLLSFGLPYTVVGMVGIPDYGLFGNGKNRLYVNRGQGSRSFLGNFISRINVPPEYSVYHIKI